MAHNPHAPQGPDPAQDPAGSTQMFRAFVDEAAPRQQPAAPQRSGPRAGLLIGLAVGIAVIAAAAWLALA